MMMKIIGRISSLAAAVSGKALVQLFKSLLIRSMKWLDGRHAHGAGHGLVEGRGVADDAEALLGAQNLRRGLRHSGSADGNGIIH